MLTLYEGHRKSRRELLKIGASTIGGLSLSGLLATRANASISEAMRDKSVVVLNMQGGPTQFETFDPKMSAPPEIRSITGETSTSIRAGTSPSWSRKCRHRSLVCRPRSQRCSPLLSAAPACQHQRGACRVAAGRKRLGRSTRRLAYRSVSELHTTRHTWATLALQAGKSVRCTSAELFGLEMASDKRRFLASA